MTEVTWAEVKVLTKGIIPTACCTVSPVSYTHLDVYKRQVANGIEALYAQTIAGGNGVNVRVHDIEYSWNRTHEDVAKLATALVPNGTPSDPFADSNHGTAVAGQIAATSNTIGVTGLVPGATLRVLSLIHI